jgi:DNA invertase Pin-like site-specific DNA recombinase
MPLAVVYARFSPRPSAEECDSVEKQTERCRAYCAGHGYLVAAAFHDKDLAGGRDDNRPGLHDAIAAARSKKAVLVVYSLDRLARSTRDAIDILDQLRRGGADLASITESLNTRSAIGQFLFELLAAFAQLQRRQIQERTSRAMRHYQANGRRMTRADCCPYGWRPDPLNASRLVEDADEQAVIERIRGYRHVGMGPRPIARALDAAGIRCRGHRWHDSAVRSILRRAEVSTTA